MRAFETTPDGTGREEKDIMYVFRKFRKHLPPTPIHLIRDKKHDIMWFTPPELFTETFQLLLAESYHIKVLEPHQIPELEKTLTENLEFFDDPSGRTIREYLETLLVPEKVGG